LRLLLAKSVRAALARLRDLLAKRGEQCIGAAAVALDNAGELGESG
jgi:hypothetical protein